MRAEQEGPLALCAETEFSAGDAAETDPAERSGALRTEEPHFLFPLRGSESCKPNAHLLQPFSPPMPPTYLLGRGRKQQRNATLVGKSEFPRAPRQTEVLGCRERLGGQEQQGPDKDRGPETSWVGPQISRRCRQQMQVMEGCGTDGI